MPNDSDADAAARFRAYAPADRDACLALFDTNVPRYFAAHERADFGRFLDALPGPYFVVEDGGAIVACGGYAAESEPGVVALCWGMVDGSRHRRGIGSLLTAERVRRAAADGACDAVTIRTSQHTAAFYARFGFVATRTVADGHAPGIDLVEMRLIGGRARPAGGRSVIE